MFRIISSVSISPTTLFSSPSSAYYDYSSNLIFLGPASIFALSIVPVLEMLT
nr:MAG TPA: hypothetical protein [Bacteriophage sp.]